MKTALATAIAFATAVLTLAPTAACADEPTRVLIVGDSVTHGLDGNYTWRYFAWKGLMQTGASVDFVGNRKGTYLDLEHKWSGSYADADFDTDHASRWGMAMSEMLDAPTADSPAIEDLMAAHQPDVIVEQLGVNDFDRMGLSAEQMADQVVEFVADARSVNPDVDVVLGSIPQTWIGDASAYNALLPTLAARISTQDSQVVATPVADFTNGVDTYDFAHPTTAGQVKIAAAVSAGLEKLGIGRAVTMPEPVAATTPAVPVPTSAPQSSATAPTTAPAPAVSLGSPRKVRAERDGRRTVVTWKKAAGSDVTVVRCGTRIVKADGRKVVVRSTAARCSVRAANESMVSPWSVVRVKQQR